jgi:protein-tyrosine phosphatase
VAREARSVRAHRCMPGLILLRREDFTPRGSRDIPAPWPRPRRRLPRRAVFQSREQRGRSLGQATGERANLPPGACDGPPRTACDDFDIGVSNHNPRWIVLDGAVNARAVVPGVLLRADNLQSLSARDVRLLVGEHGLETVIDLRTDVEAEREGPGPMTAETAVRIELRSLHPDSDGLVDLNASPIKPWDAHHENESPDEPPVVRAYMSYLRLRPDSVVGAVRTIANAQGAVLVHCAAGKDRTGVIVALALDAAGVDRDTIVADYLATAERIDAIVARLVRSPLYRDELRGHDPQRHAPVPGTIERVLELVDQRHGGSLAWLMENGLGTPDLRRLRRRIALAPSPGVAHPRLSRGSSDRQ